MDTVMTRKSKAAAAGVVLSLASMFVGATDFYVSPAGAATGDGSIAKPWKIGVALAQPPAVKPGDTIWLRGGTYPTTVGAAYTVACSLNGTATAPIKVRQYPGERATFDGYGAVYGTLLVQYATWVEFWDFEVMSSDTVGQGFTQNSTGPSGLWIRDSSHLKFIDLVVHDLTALGAGFWIENTDSEIYGSLFYYNGRSSLSHGIYMDNKTGSAKLVADSILFFNYGYGLHAYASSPTDTENGITFDGNISFNNGLIANPWPTKGSNILLGVDANGKEPAQNPVVTNNMTYFPKPMDYPTGQGFGYVMGCANPTVTGNYFVGTTRWAKCSGGTVTGNTFYGWKYIDAVLQANPAATYPANTYLSGKPAAPKVFVRPNKYEPGRANIVVYNWTGTPTVAVDLSSVLTPGASFEIRNAQNFYGPPVLSGIYAGGSVNLPMTGLVAAKPISFPVPPPTGPEFNAFVLLQTKPAPAYTPTPTPTWTDSQRDQHIKALEGVVYTPTPHP
jgi:hypothetical protein